MSIKKLWKYTQETNKNGYLQRAGMGIGSKESIQM